MIVVVGGAAERVGMRPGELQDEGASSRTADGAMVASAAVSSVFPRAGTMSDAAGGGVLVEEASGKRNGRRLWHAG